MAVDIDPEVGREFVEHFGTKGMHWGVRRSKEERARDSGKAETKPKTVVGKTKTSGKTAQTMSDADLKRVLNRLNMEQQYNRLTDPGPSRKRRAAQSITKFVLQAARNVAMTQITAQANTAVNDKVGALIKAKKLSGIPKPPNLFPTGAPDPLLRRG